MLCRGFSASTFPLCICCPDLWQTLGLNLLIAGWGASDGHGKRRLAGATTAHAATAAQSNAVWLEDCVIRLMCVLALDRFGDFVSDQVTVCLALSWVGSLAC